nr:hypothetical protein Clen_342 [Cedratvirus lena]
MDVQKLSYREIMDLCSDESSPNNLGCEWNLWREKAKLDFGVSERFFDLLRTLPGAQRYLQIKTYYFLSPDSATRLYLDSGYIEGVYTSLAGYLEAKARKNHQMALFFYSRLKEEEKNLVTSLQTVPPEAASLQTVPPGEQNEIELFCRVLRTGKVKEVDKILHDYFVLPLGFSIEADILQVPFWEEPPLYNLSSSTKIAISPQDAQRIMYASLVGLETRTVDFFRSLFRGLVLEEASSFIYQGLLMHGKAEEAYSIALRFPGLGYDYMAEMLVNPKLNSLQAESFISAFQENPGNIALLTSLLPYIRKKKVAEYYRNLDQEWDRLSNLILQDYIANS